MSRRNECGKARESRKGAQSMERKKPLEMAEQERRDGRGNTGDLTPREAAAFLRSRDNFLIVTHVRPDGVLAFWPGLW